MARIMFLADILCRSQHRWKTVFDDLRAPNLHSPDGFDGLEWCVGWHKTVGNLLDFLKDLFRDGWHKDRRQICSPVRSQMRS